MALRVFTIESGVVTAGAVIESLKLKGAGIEIPAILIGEEGRGRERGVVPVGSPPQVPCPEQGKDMWTSADVCRQCGVTLGEAQGSTRHHPDSGLVTGRLMFAEVGQTKANKPKLLAAPGATTDEKIVVVLRTAIGFRGGNSHTGDRSGTEEFEEWGEKKTRLTFAPFPGEVIARGAIAQGTAGRMGGGDQLVAIMPKDVVFRTAYYGRLYGAPGAHYYKWDGERLLAMTWEEREASDIF